LKILLFLKKKFAGIKKGHIFAALFDFKKRKGIKKFFEKIEASLAEVNTFEIKYSNKW
jgi:hypothetical protein